MYLHKAYQAKDISGLCKAHRGEPTHLKIPLHNLLSMPLGPWAVPTLGYVYPYGENSKP